MKRFCEVDRRHSAVLVMLTIAIAAPIVVYPMFLMKVLCFGLFACAFNLLLGYGGLLSFGHAMFFGGAAYVSAYAVKTLGLSPELGILAGTGAAGLLGLAVGSVAIRRQGIYFAMVTLALSQMFFFFCIQAKFTGGEDGIQSVPRRPFLWLIDTSNDLAFYYVILGITVGGLFVLWRTVHSPFGHVLKGIRENEPRAISLGYRTDHYKLLAFVISASVAGLAGAMKALVFQLASLTDVAWQMSGEVILMSLIGGIGTVFGPLLGAAIVVSIQNYFAGFGEWVQMIQGVIFVAIVLGLREGIAGAGKSIAVRWRHRKKGSQVVSAAPLSAVS